MNKAASVVRAGLEKYLYDNEYHIRDRLKRVYSGNTFDVSKLRKRQWANLKHLRSVAAGISVKRFHTDWSTIGERRGAACLYEQLRARVWALGELRRSLHPVYGDFYHLTFARHKDRRPEGTLSEFNVAGYRRKIRAVLGGLQRSFPSMWAFGIIEVSATTLDDGSAVFEPHLHLVASGVPEESIRQAFQAALGQSSRNSHPIMIKAVLDEPNFHAGLSYFVKFVPEVRTKFLTSGGRMGKGRTNHMRGSLKAEWLAWLAAIRIDELLISIGLGPKLMGTFRSCEMQRLIEKLP